VIRRVGFFVALFLAGLGLMSLGSDYLGNNPIVIGAGLSLAFAGIYILFVEDGDGEGK
jgi:hypothetical protein